MRKRKVVLKDLRDEVYGKGTFFTHWATPRSAINGTHIMYFSIHDVYYTMVNLAIRAEKTVNVLVKHKRCAKEK